MTTPMNVCLLKRSDGDYYKIHIGADWQEAASNLSSGQAFVVTPLCCFPSARIQQPVQISQPCVMLRNYWFRAQSDEEAVLQLLRARSYEAEIASDFSQDASMDDTLSESVDVENLLACTEQCKTVDASKSTDVRAVLTAKYGKDERDCSHAVRNWYGK